MVNIKVRRENRLVQLALIPGPWSGRGLIGCNIIPVENSTPSPTQNQIEH